MKSIIGFVTKFIVFREKFSTTKSPTGGQLEALRLNLGENGARDVEALYALYAAMIRIWAKLNDEEQRALILNYTPVGSQDYVRKVHRSDLHPLFVANNDTDGYCNAKLKNGNCRNRRRPGEARCSRHAHIQSQPVTFVTKASEEYLHESDDDPDMVIVRGSKAIYPRRELIATALSMTVMSVRHVLNSACDKILSNPLFGALERD